MTTHLYKWVLAVVCMISAWLASDVEMYAQTPSSDNSVVEGVVSDQSGAPLAGVSKASLRTASLNFLASA